MIQSKPCQERDQEIIFLNSKEKSSMDNLKDLQVYFHFDDFTDIDLMVIALYCGITSSSKYPSQNEFMSDTCYIGNYVI